MIKLLVLAASITLLQTAPPVAADKVPVQPEPVATPTGVVAGRAINEAAPQGPAPPRATPRPAKKPGVKFGQ